LALAVLELQQIPLGALLGITVYLALLHQQAAAVVDRV
jgi:hypothetical protein